MQLAGAPAFAQGPGATRGPTTYVRIHVSGTDEEWRAAQRFSGVAAVSWCLMCRPSRRARPLPVKPCQTHHLPLGAYSRPAPTRTLRVPPRSDRLRKRRNFRNRQSQARAPVGTAFRGRAGSQGTWQAERSASTRRIPKSVPVAATPAMQHREDRGPDSAARGTQVRNLSYLVRRMSEHTGRQVLLRPRPFARTVLCRSLSCLPESSEPDAPKPETVGLPQ